MKLRRTFGVATGQSRYPTPLGAFQIVVKWRNPWWYPPQSDWAKDAQPIPPGPGNPLGTRWMGISSPAVGIHGTPDPASIGYSVSHGCIRMLIPEVEWLFNQVDVGTPVYIVR
jgi:lipoprotein-anchoring transpeptidase ErfK/SrfK